MIAQIKILKKGGLHLKFFLIECEHKRPIEIKLILSSSMAEQPAVNR